MLAEYIGILGKIYFFCYWPFLITAFLLARDANIRWSLLIFMFAAGASHLAGYVQRTTGISGVYYHLSQVVIGVLVVKVLIVFRPLISLRIGSWLGTLPVCGVLLSHALPAHYSWKIFPAELALRRVFKGYVAAHSLAIIHYVVNSLGFTAKHGFLQSIGLDGRSLWDCSFLHYSLLTLLELLLLFSLVLSGIKSRSAMKA